MKIRLVSYIYVVRMKRHKTMKQQWQDFLKTQLAQASSENAIFDLSHLGLLQLSGEDHLDFIQKQVTNDINLLDGHNAQFTGYCSPKGRLLALFLAFSHYDHLHLQLNGELTETILKRLKMYVMRAKVTIEDMSESIIRIGVAGEKSNQVLADIFEKIPVKPYQLVSLEKGAILRLGGDIPRYIVYSNIDNISNIWQILGQTHTYVDKNYWELLEIEAGIPEIFPTTQEAFVPQMINLDAFNAINYKKGCYTGQEIIARTHYLGKVKRRTLLAELVSEITPKIGDDVFGKVGTEAVGKIVRIAQVNANVFKMLVEARLENFETGVIFWQDKPLQFKALPYSV